MTASDQRLGEIFLVIHKTTQALIVFKNFLINIIIITLFSYCRQNYNIHLNIQKPIKISICQFYKVISYAMLERIHHSDDEIQKVNILMSQYVA